MNFSKIILVGLGGFGGAVLRCLISDAARKFLGDFPVGTLIVNIAGGLLMGFIMEAGAKSVSPNFRAFLTTGLLGGLTTFSTFSYETVSLFSSGKYVLGGLNAGLNLCLALFACWIGMAAARALIRA
jgi:CrcB protein